MRLLDQLERRLGRWAVPNLSMLLILGQVAVYLLDLAQRSNAPNAEPLLARLMLVGELVLGGEVWRLFTFLLIPPSAGPTGLLWNLIGWLFFYFVGSVMEQSWGELKFNLYMLLGWLFMVAASFLEPTAAIVNIVYYASVFLAFARLYPDYVIRIFYVLPIKAKWLALIEWLVILLSLISAPGLWPVILAPVANYFVFFWREHYRDFHQQRRRAAFQAKAAPKRKPGQAMHTCQVCGRNSADEPRTQFRYCSQCAGQICYCPDHIREHEHVAEAAAKQ